MFHIISPEDRDLRLNDFGYVISQWFEISPDTSSLQVNTEAESIGVNTNTAHFRHRLSAAIIATRSALPRRLSRSLGTATKP